MSGIYISGVEMPKNCYGCLFSVKSDTPKHPFVDCKIIGRLGSIFNAVSIPVDCPLISVPDHGRLVDADALCVYEREERARNEYCENGYDSYAEGVFDGLHEAAKIISVAPTIIPANKGVGEC